ncbi:MAG: hypothetical protein ACKVS8_01905 [Phycisphaerales bacterium]
MTTHPQPPDNPDALHRFLADVLNIRVPRTSLLEASDAPFDYLCHTFFEGKFTRGQSHAGPSLAEQVAGAHAATDTAAASPARIDPVVWASRGGGKTFLGAVATLLDLLFKQGCEVRILGGSLEQSGRMHEHLRRLCEISAVSAHIARKSTAKRLLFNNGSRAEILAQSETAVRGTRVQKVRCDEVDLFNPAVWRAAQLTTRSLGREGPWGTVVHGRIEALSTMNAPMGIMWDLVSESVGGNATRRLFRWGVVDALEHCSPRHACEPCVLWPECGGRAKLRPPADAGHITIADALAMKARVSLEMWQSEMLCLRPRRASAVIPEFDPRTHILREDAIPHRGTWIAGMDFGFRSPTVILWAHVDETGILRVMHERSADGAVMDEHIRAVTDGLRPHPAWVGVDPAGNARNDQTGLSNVNLLRKAGLAVRSRQSAVEDGLRLLRARFGPATGSPRLFVHARCVKLIESLRRYRYPEDKPEAMQPVKDGHDHAVDALRYMVMNLDRPHETRQAGYL